MINIDIGKKNIIKSYKIILLYLLLYFININILISIEPNNTFDITNLKINSINQNNQNNNNDLSLDNITNNLNSVIVVNASKGEILYSKNQDKQIYLASLTKMMTAYIIFDLIKNSSIGLYDKIYLTNKDMLNLQSESQHYNYNNQFLFEHTITIYDLLARMITRSSNIAANILAKECGAGNIENFIKMMNDKARQLNMNNTHFTNPNGLFDINNYSTTRDIVVLNIKLVSNFSNYITLFSLSEYVDNGNVIFKTTNIENNVKNVIGSKTGYISVSGYNLSIWGVVNNDKVFITLSGAKTAEQRDYIATKIFTNLSIDKNLYNKLGVNRIDNTNFDKININYITSNNDKIENNKDKINHHNIISKFLYDKSINIINFLIDEKDIEKIMYLTSINYPNKRNINIDAIQNRSNENINLHKNIFDNYLKNFTNNASKTPVSRFHAIIN